MDINELIHKLEKARTKDDLEKLGIDHLDINVDKRKAKEVLRAELIGEAEARLELAPQTVAEPAAEPQAQEPAPSTEPQTPEPEVAETPDETEFKVKMGRNRNNGRLLPWTSAMAKMPHMEEV